MTGMFTARPARYIRTFSRKSSASVSSLQARQNGVSSRGAKLKWPCTKSRESSNIVSISWLNRSVSTGSNRLSGKCFTSWYSAA